MEIIRKWFLPLLLIALFNCNGQDKKKKLEKIDMKTEEKTLSNFILQKITSEDKDTFTYQFPELICKLIPSEKQTLNLSVNNSLYETDITIESAQVNIWNFKNSENHFILIEGDDYYGSTFYVYLYNSDKKDLSYFGNFVYENENAEKNKQQKAIILSLNEEVVNIEVTLNQLQKNFQLKKIEQIKLSRIEKDTKYSIITEKKADINQDGKLDQITVYNTQWNKEINPSDSKLFKIVVKLSNNENKFITLTNDNIIEPYYPDNVASGFSDIKIKDNYFTVEQANGGGGIIDRSFITFKYDKLKKGIYLHRYSVLTTEMSSGDEKESKTEKTTKDFGLISFENFNIKTINSK
ncbi:hypothetical protein [Chryseobacterium sp. BIGb0232]|uniref:hypothetical protein n=1 Tax=Chryseobacterium sp. BIGb0232 TaxID=2940598 RepID=UPI000F4ACB18|nr:hypothetical protein [Chryseobacterium sp. BIGb0232]MCS4302303.1 hypothetical protein [Chryseobacterium sp. BIGb0232]ROS18248.1 hypothetical protein EDF65_2640 [Chryseobacterium nakagawai]